MNFYTICAFFYGVFATSQSIFNTKLSAVYGTWAGSGMVHAVGLLVLLPTLLTPWGKKKGSAPWYDHLGGFVGILPLVFTVLALPTTGVTINLAMSMLGMVVFSCLMDSLGLFGMEKIRLRGMKILAICVLALGSLTMIALSGDKLEGNLPIGLVLPLCFAGGVTLVAARVLNSRLSKKCGAGYSTIMNFLTGLIGCTVIVACMRFQIPVRFPAAGQPWYIYIGGALGATGIFLCNVASPKLSVLQMTVIGNVGQIFTGIVIDAIIGKFSLGTIIGGAIVTIGMILNTKADAAARAKEGRQH
ncbi:MAG: DMT family transporter [Oscillospiraceae bacterium]|nr:DMT family transporter [Oscillospiraceae bacterium]